MKNTAPRQNADPRTDEEILDSIEDKLDQLLDSSRRG